MNSTFIILVPKKYRYIKVHDIRSISLVSSVYKIISNVILVRVGKVLGILFLSTEVLLLQEYKF